MDVEDEHVELVVNKTVRSLRDYVEENDISVTNEFRPAFDMAPTTLRSINPSCFKPRVVSIGPIHHNDENLQRYEERKAAAVKHLLSGSESSLTACVRKVGSMIERIRGCYVGMLHYYDDSELAKMMVMDACFILDFIQESARRYNPYMLIGKYITYDLVLLENQIPFFVLEGIYECIINKFEERLPITEFILPLLEYVNLFVRTVNVQEFSKTRSDTNYDHHDHILGYLHHCYLPRDYIIPSNLIPSYTIHSAVELDMAGVNIKCYSDQEWALAMKVNWNRSRILWFWFKPTLAMPNLYIDEFTELVLWNLIAYEQAHVANRRYFTSYAGAMGMLINTQEDIATLVRSKIIVNRICSNEEAANMINRVCKQVLPECFYYTDQFLELHMHFEGYWTRTIMKFKRSYSELKKTYFSSPWSAIALFAGIALFVLTLIQTIYTVKSFKTK